MAESGYSVGELAQRFGLRAQGDVDARVTGVATLERAQPHQLAFLANPRYRAQLAETRAGVVVMRESDAVDHGGNALLAKDPYSAYARIAALFEHAEPVDAGIHLQADIDPSARIDPSASIGAFVSIGPRTVIEAGARIGPGCVIGPDCRIGTGSILIARVTLVQRVQIGQRVRAHPGVVIGADGFGIAMHEGAWIKVPQLGGVRIGDDCEIGANSCIDRGALDDTVLEEDVRLDNLIQIGHNVHIGAHTAIAGAAAVAGSTRIGKHCLIGGGVGVVGHIAICDRVTVTARTLVTHSIDKPGEYSSGTPMMDNRSWRKSAARFKQLDAIARRCGQEKDTP